MCINNPLTSSILTEALFRTKWDISCILHCSIQLTIILKGYCLLGLHDRLVALNGPMLSVRAWTIGLVCWDCCFHDFSELPTLYRKPMSICWPYPIQLWGPLWDHYGTTMGPLWDHYGTTMGPLWDHYGTIMGPLWDHYGTTMGPLWDHYGTTMGPLWDHYGTTMGPLWDHYGTTMGPLWDHYGTTMGPLWDHYGTTMGPLWK